MDHDEIEYMAPDAELVQKLMQRVLENEQGRVGLKLLPFIEEPGIAYNYRIQFEDGTGEVIHEEILPVFVDREHRDPQQRLGRRIVEGKSINGMPEEQQVRTLLEHEHGMRAAADRYISQRIRSLRSELQERRREETWQELEDLEAYAETPP